MYEYLCTYIFSKQIFLLTSLNITCLYLGTGLNVKDGFHTLYDGYRMYIKYQICQNIIASSLAVTSAMTINAQTGTTKYSHLKFAS